MFGASLQSRATRPSGRIGRWWAGCYTGVILIGSLMPAPAWPGAQHHFFAALLPTTRNAWLDVIANVAFYLPLGIALSARGIPVGRISIGAAALATTTELLQYFVPGRDPSASD